MPAEVTKLLIPEMIYKSKINCFISAKVRVIKDVAWHIFRLNLLIESQNWYIPTCNIFILQKVFVFLNNYYKLICTKYIEWLIEASIYTGTVKETSRIRNSENAIN